MSDAPDQEPKAVSDREEGQSPFILRFVAMLMIIHGGASIVQTGSSLVDGRLYFDLGVIGIPLGRGLLEGRQSSRLWTIALSGLGLLVIGILCIKGNVPQQSQWYYGGYVLLAVMDCAVAFFGLQMPSVRAWFKTTSLAPPDWSVWTAPLALAGILISIPGAMDNYLIKSTFRDLYPVRTRFEFRDAATGAPVRVVNNTLNHSINSNGDDLRMPRVYISHQSMENNVHFHEAKGTACVPVEVEFSAEGYRTQTYTLSKKSPREVLIKLQPLEANPTAPSP